MTYRAENALFITKHIVFGVVAAVAIWQLAAWVAPDKLAHVTVELANLAARLDHFLASFWTLLKELVHGQQTAGRPIPRYFPRPEGLVHNLRPFARQRTATISD